MNRFFLEHLIRSASQITKKDSIYIVGSQSIHGGTRNITAMADKSDEADFFTSDPNDADLIDAILGEESTFHLTHKYYAQGVDINTAILAEGWENRVNIIESNNTNGAKGVCISIPDLI